jgi:hypothetical protein
VYRAHGFLQAVPARHDGDGQLAGASSDSDDVDLFARNGGEDAPGQPPEVRAAFEAGMGIEAGG